eukprot:8698570-Alexandrium_andersonii.AAC.1
MSASLVGSEMCIRDRYFCVLSGPFGAIPPLQASIPRGCACVWPPGWPGAASGSPSHLPRLAAA